MYAQVLNHFFLQPVQFLQLRIGKALVDLIPGLVDGLVQEVSHLSSLFRAEQKLAALVGGTGLHPDIACLAQLLENTA